MARSRTVRHQRREEEPFSSLELLTSVAPRRPPKPHPGAQLGAPWPKPGAPFSDTSWGTNFLSRDLDQVILVTPIRWSLGVNWVTGGSNWIDTCDTGEWTYLQLILLIKKSYATNTRFVIAFFIVTVSLRFVTKLFWFLCKSIWQHVTDRQGWNWMCNNVNFLFVREKHSKFFGHSLLWATCFEVSLQCIPSY